jgi:hypothetical protein
VLSLIEYKQAEKIIFLHSCNVADLSTFASFATSLNTSAKAFVFIAMGSQRADAPSIKIKKVDHSIRVNPIFVRVAVATQASPIVTFRAFYGMATPSMRPRHLIRRPRLGFATREQINTIVVATRFFRPSVSIYS